MQLAEAINSNEYYLSDAAFLVGAGISMSRGVELPNATTVKRAVIKTLFPDRFDAEKTAAKMIIENLLPETLFASLADHGFKPQHFWEKLTSFQRERQDFSENHLAVCQAACRARGIILTPNFDTALECAAKEIAGTRVVVLLPDGELPEAIPPNTLYVVKYHGCAELGGIASTTSGITSSKKVIESFFRHHSRVTLCIAGWSAGDFDLLIPLFQNLPQLKGMRFYSTSVSRKWQAQLGSVHGNGFTESIQIEGSQHVADKEYEGLNLAVNYIRGWLSEWTEDERKRCWSSSGCSPC